MTGSRGTPIQPPIYDTITFCNTSLVGESTNYEIGEFFDENTHTSLPLPPVPTEADHASSRHAQHELWVASSRTVTDTCLSSSTNKPISMAKRKTYEIGKDYATAEEVGLQPQPPLPCQSSSRRADTAGVAHFRELLSQNPDNHRIGHDYAKEAPIRHDVGAGNQVPEVINRMNIPPRRNTSAPDLLVCKLPFNPNSLHRTCPYEKNPYYHGALSRDAAEAILKEAKMKSKGADGIFLLRDTSKAQDMLCISVIYRGNNKIFHNRVQRLPNGTFHYLGTAEQCPPFLSCEALIHYHHTSHPRITKLNEQQINAGSIRLSSYVLRT